MAPTHAEAAARLAEVFGVAPHELPAGRATGIESMGAHLRAGRSFPVRGAKPPGRGDVSGLSSPHTSVPAAGFTPCGPNNPVEVDAAAMPGRQTAGEGVGGR